MKARRRPGRPSALIPEVESRILNAIRCGAPNRVACAAAGISEGTLYSWLRAAEEKPKSQCAAFAEKIDRARQEGITARLGLVMKAAAKDWRAAAWMSEREMPEAFSARFKIEHATKEPTFWAVVARLRKDERRAALPEPVKVLEAQTS